MYHLLQKTGLLKQFSLVPVYDFNAKNNDEERRIIPTDAEIKKAMEELDSEIKTSGDLQKINF
jgi:hypothetical protein